MTTYSPKQIEEINAIIKTIEAEVKPDIEIGARDRVILTGILRANKIEKTPKFFKCRREYSDAIITHFVKEKGIAKNKFNMSTQTFIYLI